MAALTSLWPGAWEIPVRYAPDANPYIGHRLTLPSIGGAAVACDCGELFDSIVDLEWHQHRYRHPGILGSVG